MTSLFSLTGIIVNNGNHPQMAQEFRSVKYSNLPMYIYIYTYSNHMYNIYNILKITQLSQVIPRYITFQDMALVDRYIYIYIIYPDIYIDINILIYPVYIYIYIGHIPTTYSLYIPYRFPTFFCQERPLMLVAALLSGLLSMGGTWQLDVFFFFRFSSRWNISRSILHEWI